MDEDMDTSVDTADVDTSDMDTSSDIDTSDVAEDISDDVPEDIPEDDYSDYDDDIEEEIPEDTEEDDVISDAEDAVEDIPEDIDDETVEETDDLPDEVPEDTLDEETIESDDTSDEIAEDIEENEITDTDDDLPDEISEDIPDTEEVTEDDNAEIDDQPMDTDETVADETEDAPADVTDTEADEQPTDTDETVTDETEDTPADVTDTEVDDQPTDTEETVTDETEDAPADVTDTEADEQPTDTDETVTDEAEDTTSDETDTETDEQPADTDETVTDVDSSREKGDLETSPEKDISGIDETVGEFSPSDNPYKDDWEKFSEEVNGENQAEATDWDSLKDVPFAGEDTETNNDVATEISKIPDDKTDWENTSLTPEQQSIVKEMDENGEINIPEVNNEWEEPIKPTQHLPTEKTGEFADERGNSSFKPNNQEALQKMSEYGRDTVDYINGEPDFSPFAKYQTENGELDTTVEIGHMTDSRDNPTWEMGRRPNGTSHDPNYELGNFAQAENELLKKFPEGSTIDDVTDFIEKNNLTWHECPDGKTMQLVPTEIHDACRHSGGVSEQKFIMQYGDVEIPTDDFVSEQSSDLSQMSDIHKDGFFGNYETDMAANGSEYFVKGNNYEKFKDNYYSPDESEYISYGDNYTITDISPSDIEGIYISENDYNDPTLFWQQHKDGGTSSSFNEIASHIPEVRQQLDSGNELSSIRNDPSLGECADIYFAPENIPRVIENDGYYEFDSNGRHRILAARNMGYDIPVKIIGKRSKKI